jgi:hypothetical protein
MLFAYSSVSKFASLAEWQATELKPIAHTTALVRMNAKKRMVQVFLSVPFPPIPGPNNYRYQIITLAHTRLKHYSTPTGRVRRKRQRLRCVLGMLNSLEVKVLWPT